MGVQIKCFNAYSNIATVYSEFCAKLILKKLLDKTFVCDPQVDLSFLTLYTHSKHGERRQHGCLTSRKLVCRNENEVFLSRLPRP